MLTLFSAPNYCYRCGNVASVLALDDQLNRDFRIFKDVPDAEDSVEALKRKLVPYFL